MKRLLFLALFAATAAPSKSATEGWLDPEIFAVNRAPMRTSFIAFPSAADAVPENDHTLSPLYRTLNGEWSFLRVDRPGAEPEGFFRTGARRLVVGRDARSGALGTERLRRSGLHEQALSVAQILRGESSAGSP